jgi:hypothetical protein
MINLLVALPPEAKPLIRTFGLQRRQPDGEFPLYVSHEITLSLCGHGSDSMGQAIEFLLQNQPTPVSGWINFGIAGHGSLDRGRCLLIDSVIEQSTGAHWELNSIPVDGISRSTLHCVSQPESAYADNSAYDMESAGFTSTLAAAALLQRGQIMKVVSDNPRQPSSEINGKMVSNLIEESIPALTLLMEQLQSYAAST